MDDLALLVDEELFKVPLECATPLSAAIRDEGVVGGAAYLDTREPKEARLLALEPLVDLVGVVAIHIRLLHQREIHAVVALAELGDVLV